MTLRQSCWRYKQLNVSPLGNEFCFNSNCFHCFIPPIRPLRKPSVWLICCCFALQNYETTEHLLEAETLKQIKMQVEKCEQPYDIQTL